MKYPRWGPTVSLLWRECRYRVLAIGHAPSPWCVDRVMSPGAATAMTRAGRAATRQWLAKLLPARFVIHQRS